MKTVIFFIETEEIEDSSSDSIVIWETETNFHSDVHKPHVLPSSNALVCVTYGCFYKTVLVSQVIPICHNLMGYRLTIPTSRDISYCLHCWSGGRRERDHDFHSDQISFIPS
ncbi:hypothetical protein E2C01_035303 [Portunus trituberculatus]|uniref:Uncharacterized protein n=1 Tax=Portunus trituberculatus TaxID=210409 RepID=A0A5B7F5C6_PORTR|nr:hypothetical protein [Portunus trituberculatus]